MCESKEGGGSPGQHLSVVSAPHVNSAITSPAALDHATDLANQRRAWAEVEEHGSFATGHRCDGRMRVHIPWQAHIRGTECAQLAGHGGVVGIYEADSIKRLKQVKEARRALLTKNPHDDKMSAAVHNVCLTVR